MGAMTDMEMEEINPELQAIEEELRKRRAAEQLKHMESLGRHVAKCRDEAVAGRKLSGIEDIWVEDEEYFQGIDDANRTTHHWLKSPGTTGGMTSQQDNKGARRCTYFFNITRQFVDSAAARMGDILLPAGDWNFSIKPSPVQDDLENGQTVASPQPQTPVVANPQAPIQPPSISLEDTRQADAEKRSEKAETWIQDKLIECAYHSEARYVIEDAARLGTGVLKGPFPNKVTLRRSAQTETGHTLELVEETVPASKSIDPRDFFPDPSCGDNIQNGNYVIERGRLTARQLRLLKGTTGYVSDLIDSVLDEGPSRKHYDDNGNRKGYESTADDDVFDVWYFHGDVDANDIDCMCDGGKESEKHMVPAIVTLINDTVIKAALSPIDSGTFPYDVMPWQRVSGCWYGIGVARQGRTAQAMLNASFRAMMDNMGLSAGPQIIIRDGCIYPADNDWTIAPRKVWRVTELAEGRSLNDFFAAINIPSMQIELSNIITLALKAMEDATGLSYLLQGQQGSAPDTVGGMELLHRNASAILRRLARVFDERVTEPHIRRYYNWLLLHGPEDCKGDMKIEAIGSTALVEREIQSMDSMILLQMSVNPVYGLDPALAMSEVLKVKRFSPEKWQLSDEKKKAIQPPMVPVIEAAKIRAEVDMKRIELDKDKTIAMNQLKKHEIDVDTDRDTIYNQSLADREEMSLKIRLEELKVKRELAILDHANKRGISLDKVKADLAQEAMKLRVQKELTSAGGKGPQVTTPVFEPPGRADEGRAFIE